MGSQSHCMLISGSDPTDGEHFTIVYEFVWVTGYYFTLLVPVLKCDKVT